jgi:outer membrane protein assembly factor BamB
MTKPSLIIILALLVLLAFAGEAENGDKLYWPQFRGPNSTGIGDSKPPVEFGSDKNVLWTVAVRSGVSSPVLAEGRIFLTEFDRATNQLATLCLDQRTGKTLWRRTLAPAQIEKFHDISSPAAPTPATDRERVYVYFGSYGLVSYDFDGKVQWERQLPLTENIYGAVASPIVCRGFAGAESSRKRSLPARRQPSRWPDRLENGPLEVSVRLVDASVLASRRSR